MLELTSGFQYPVFKLCYGWVGDFFLHYVSQILFFNERSSFILYIKGNPQLEIKCYDSSSKEQSQI